MSLETDAATIARIRSALLAHYRAHARDLPWRRDRDPYRIWVSEVMLQQTRVDTAAPYYERWLERFPTVESLAEAPIDDVLREWAGLGYYRRAHNLHRAAKLVRERHGGRLPSDAAELRALPGIGDYTAGAIASIAFDRAEPAVDGNVRRVLSRLFDLADPSASEVRRIAAALVPEIRPGEFNQALMEFGSTVCAPRAPACETCPLAGLCRARAVGTQLERPRPKRAKPVPEVDIATAVVVDPTGRVLLRRRPEEGLLGGMWEFPGEATEVASATAETDNAGAVADTAETAARRVAQSALAALQEGLSIAGTSAPLGTAQTLGTVPHIFSHLRARYHAFRFELKVPIASGPAANTEFGPSVEATRLSTDEERATTRWAPIAQLEEFALPAAQRRIAALAFGKPGRLEGATPNRMAGRAPDA